jgi:hypothetical protein|nr:MAG TPA: hypothetical protein [Caudoviricetes sp.]
MENNKIISFNEMTYNSIYIGVQRKDIIKDNKKIHDEINFFTYFVSTPNEYLTDDLDHTLGVIIHYRITDDSDNSVIWSMILEELNQNDKDYARYNGFLKIDKSEVILTYPYITRIGAILALTHLIGSISHNRKLKVTAL